MFCIVTLIQFYEKVTHIFIMCQDVLNIIKFSLFWCVSLDYNYCTEMTWLIQLFLIKIKTRNQM